MRLDTYKNRNKSKHPNAAQFSSQPPIGLVCGVCGSYKTIRKHPKGALKCRCSLQLGVK